MSEYNAWTYKDQIIEEKQDGEYDVTITDYGQRYSGNCPVAKLTYDTDAQMSDIENAEIYFQSGYEGGYQIDKGVGLWSIRAKGETLEEDLTVILKITFKNGQEAYDHAILHIKNQVILFDKFDFEVETRQDKGAGDVTLIDEGEYSMISDSYKQRAILDSGVWMSVQRIRQTITAVSSDSSVVSVDNSFDYDKRKCTFYITPHSVGTATISISATDDSGQSRSASVTVNVLARKPITDFTVISDSQYLTGNEQDGFVLEAGRTGKVGITNIEPQDYNLGKLSDEGSKIRNIIVGSISFPVTVYGINNSGSGSEILTKNVDVDIVGDPVEDVYALLMTETVSQGDTFRVYLKSADDDIGNLYESGIATWVGETGVFELNGETYNKLVTVTVTTSASGEHNLTVAHRTQGLFYMYKFGFTVQ